MLTPVEVTRDGIYLKRDDLYDWNGIKGAKARSIVSIIGNEKPSGLVSCGPLNSSQAAAVGLIAHKLQLPCRIHVPDGELGDGPFTAQMHGAEIVKHDGFGLDELDKTSREDAKERRWRHIPLGCTAWPSIVATASAVANLPRVKRIIVPVGTGTQLCGVLWGAMASGVTDKVLGVVHCNGIELPTQTLKRYGPPGYDEVLDLIDADREPRTEINRLSLNPDYEAFAAAYAEPGDLLWLVGGPCSWR